MNSERYNEVLTLIRNVYEWAPLGDFESIGRHVTDDFRILEADSLPFGGEYRGLEGWQSLYAHVLGMFDDPEVTLHDVTVGEDHAIGIMTLSVTSKATGERGHFEICEVFELRDGKICGIKPYYFDTQIAVALAGAA